MRYQSTRNNNLAIQSATAIASGISKEGGLFVPKNLPQLTLERLEKLVTKGYIERAENILADFLTDFSKEELHACVEGAYGEGFDNPRIAPISQLYPDLYMLELWHGPTCAFKDMALQLLPHLLTTSMEKEYPGKTAAILVATSGDTGKAALEGFRDVKGTQMLVFYPRDGVSQVQELQMRTQEGKNLSVCAIEGNFDDAQTAVKKIFTDPALAEELAKKNIMFSSANSINWGRLVPQIVYYISAYCDLVADEEIAMGDVVNVVVPTGNFGNILAAYYAKYMGLPIGKLICASNQNHVLTDFIQTGTYNRNREFHLTMSPSMDILISSNLERLLYHLSGEQDVEIRELMNSLAETGSYTVSDTIKNKLQQDFYGGFCDEQATAQTIKELFETYSYLCDPHTAVAVNVHHQYVAETGDNTKAILASTANPYKFSASVLAALDPTAKGEDELALATTLEELTGESIPAAIAELAGKPIRFDVCCKKENIVETACTLLESLPQ